MSDDAKRATTADVIDGLVGQGFLFTALDVSNEVKARLDGVRHRDIAPIVRELYEDGTMTDYTRTLIDVVAAGGKNVQAFLYHHEEDDPDDYDGDLREQKPRPPSSRGNAATSSGPTSTPASAATPAPGPNLDATQLSLRRERDGSIEIPCGFLERAGIHDPTVHLDAAGVGAGLVLVPPDPSVTPLAELDVDDVVVVPADRLSAFDGNAPIVVRRGLRKIEIDGKLR